MKFYCPYCKSNLLSSEKERYSEDDTELDEQGIPCYRFGNSDYRIVKCGKCDRIFFQTDSHDTCGNHYNTNSWPKQFDKKEFSGSISKISPTFIETYNQALEASEYGLDQIVGVALRKALEFLIKDFLANVFPDKANEIKQDKSLSNVISNRIPSTKKYLSLQGLKELSLRAWWLGSDHTHYYVRYQDKDIDDLISCINLTVSEIEIYFKKLATIESIAK